MSDRLRDLGNADGLLRIYLSIRLKASSVSSAGTEKERNMNRLKTIILLASLTSLLMWAGQALAGAAGPSFAVLVAALMNIGAYWFSDKIVLRMHHAQEVSPAQAPE